MLIGGQQETDGSDTVFKSSCTLADERHLMTEQQRKWVYEGRGIHAEKHEDKEQEFVVVELEWLVFRDTKDRAKRKG